MRLAIISLQDLQDFIRIIELPLKSSFHPPIPSFSSIRKVRKFDYTQSEMVKLSI